MKFFKIAVKLTENFLKISSQSKLICLVFVLVLISLTSAIFYGSDAMRDHYVDRILPTNNGNTNSYL